MVDNNDNFEQKFGVDVKMTCDHPTENDRNESYPENINHSENDRDKILSDNVNKFKSNSLNFYSENTQNFPDSTSMEKSGYFQADETLEDVQNFEIVVDDVIVNDIEENVIVDHCVENVIVNDIEENVIVDHCVENVIVNDIEENVIVDHCVENVIVGNYEKMIVNDSEENENVIVDDDKESVPVNDIEKNVSRWKLSPGKERRNNTVNLKNKVIDSIEYFIERRGSNDEIKSQYYDSEDNVKSCFDEGKESYGVTQMDTDIIICDNQEINRNNNQKINKNNNYLHMRKKTTEIDIEEGELDEDTSDFTAETFQNETNGDVFKNIRKEICNKRKELEALQNENNQEISEINQIFQNEIRKEEIFKNNQMKDNMKKERKHKKGKNREIKKRKNDGEEERKNRRKRHHSNEEENTSEIKPTHSKPKKESDFDTLLQQEMASVIDKKLKSSENIESKIISNKIEPDSEEFKLLKLLKQFKDREILVGKSEPKTPEYDSEEEQARPPGRRSPRSTPCVYFQQGSCKMGECCPYSHDFVPKRKMELCKFYMMNCCAKKLKCLYMHEDFPCKYHHFGMKCRAGPTCKFSHGPLREETKTILQKHIDFAPKDILGDFPRVNRLCADLIISVTAKMRAGETPDKKYLDPLLDFEGIGFKYLDKAFRSVRRKDRKEEREDLDRESEGKPKAGKHEKDKKRSKEERKERKDRTEKLKKERQLSPRRLSRDDRLSDSENELHNAHKCDRYEESDKINAEDPYSSIYELDDLESNDNLRALATPKKRPLLETPVAYFDQNRTMKNLEPIQERFEQNRPIDDHLGQNRPIHARLGPFDTLFEKIISKVDRFEQKTPKDNPVQENRPNIDYFKQNRLNNDRFEENRRKDERFERNRSEEKEFGLNNRHISRNLEKSEIDNFIEQNRPKESRNFDKDSILGNDFEQNRHTKNFERKMNAGRDFERNRPMDNTKRNVPGSRNLEEEVDERLYRNLSTHKHFDENTLNHEDKVFQRKSIPSLMDQRFDHMDEHMPKNERFDRNRLTDYRFEQNEQMDGKRFEKNINEGNFGQNRSKDQRSSMETFVQSMCVEENSEQNRPNIGNFVQNMCTDGSFVQNKPHFNQSKSIDEKFDQNRFTDNDSDRDCRETTPMDEDFDHNSSPNQDHNSLSAKNTGTSKRELANDQRKDKNLNIDVNYFKTLLSKIRHNVSSKCDTKQEILTPGEKSQNRAKIMAENYKAMAIDIREVFGDAPGGSTQELKGFHGVNSNNMDASSDPRFRKSLDVPPGNDLRFRESHDPRFMSRVPSDFRDSQITAGQRPRSNSQNESEKEIRVIPKDRIKDSKIVESRSKNNLEDKREIKIYREISIYNFDKTESQNCLNIFEDNFDSLPFKVPMHGSAKEIDASFKPHLRLNYQLIKIDVPKPNFSKLKISSNDSKCLEDPRLRNFFKNKSVNRLSSPKTESDKLLHKNVDTDKIDDQRARESYNSPRNQERYSESERSPYCDSRANNFNESVNSSTNLSSSLPRFESRSQFNIDPRIPEQNINFDSRMMENNRNFDPRMMENNRNFDPRMMKNFNFDPRMMEHNPNFDPRIVKNNSSFDPRMMENNPNFDPRMMENNPNIDPRMMENNPNFDPRMMENNPNLDPRMIENKRNFDPSKDQQVRRDPRHRSRNEKIDSVGENREDKSGRDPRYRDRSPEYGRDPRMPDNLQDQWNNNRSSLLGDFPGDHRPGLVGSFSGPPMCPPFGPQGPPMGPIGLNQGNMPFEFQPQQGMPPNMMGPGVGPGPGFGPQMNFIPMEMGSHGPNFNPNNSGPPFTGPNSISRPPFTGPNNNSGPPFAGPNNNSGPPFTGPMMGPNFNEKGDRS